MKMTRALRGERAGPGATGCVGTRPQEPRSIRRGETESPESSLRLRVSTLSVSCAVSCAAASPRRNGRAPPRLPPIPRAPLLVAGDPPRPVAGVRVRGASTWGVPGRPADRTQRLWNAAPMTLRRVRPWAWHGHRGGAETRVPEPQGGCRCQGRARAGRAGAMGHG